MPHCSYCNYTASTNSRFQRHLDTDKHARNFMLVDAGVRDLVENEDVPINDVPINEDDDEDDDVPINDDDDVPDLVRIEDYSEPVDDFKYAHIDHSSLELAAISANILSSLSQFFHAHPIVTSCLQFIGFVGIFFLKSNLDKHILVDSE